MGLDWHSAEQTEKQGGILASVEAFGYDGRRKGKYCAL